MTKYKTKLLIIVTLMLVMAAALVPFLLWSAQASPLERPGGASRSFTSVVSGTTPPLTAVNHPSVPAAAPVSISVTDSSALLNARHRFALGMIETANNDGEIGGAGEVSRYQIMPSVWQHYSSSRRYHDPGTSTEVAQQHWSALHDCFKQQTHREPTDFDMYVLWNTRYGYYSHHGFKPASLDSVVREHAQRFVNLIQRGVS